MKPSSDVSNELDFISIIDSLVIPSVGDVSSKNEIVEKGIFLISIRRKKISKMAKYAKE